MATTRNLAPENQPMERSISKKLFWGQFHALIFNDKASDGKMLCECCTAVWAEETVDVLELLQTIHSMTTDPLPSSKMKLYRIRKQKQMEAIFVPPDNN